MKIGMACLFWGTPRGHGYVNLDLANIFLGEGHEVHIYRYLDNEIMPEYPKVTSIKSSKQRVISREDFDTWLDDIKPDVVFFNEYQQWDTDVSNKVFQCKQKGIKTVGWLVWERLDYNFMEQYKLYDKIIVPSGFQTKLMRKYGLYNTYHTPWGVDIKAIDSVKEFDKKKEKLTFYHCAGGGGVSDRKNTNAVVEAYEIIKDDNTELVITHLTQQVLLKEDIIRLTKYCDVLVNTSRWDTIGINTLESNACGKPVIICNASPMNEFVKDNINGSLVKCIMKDSVPNVTCPSAEVDIKDLASKMNLYKNELILKTLQNNARKFAEDNFDWKKNKVKIFEVFERWK